MYIRGISNRATKEHKMTNPRTKKALAKISQQRTEGDARRAASDEAVHAELVDMADGTGRLQKYLRNNPAAAEAEERHRQREIAKGKPGW